MALNKIRKPSTTMPEDTKDETSTETSGSDFDPILSVDDFNKRTKARVEREVSKRTAKYADYDDLQAKAKRLAELEQANLSEAERQAERIRALETELLNERHGNLRRDVAAAKGVPADRISGSTREELEASADDLLAFIEQRAAPPKAPRQSNLRSGASNTEAVTDPKERAAAALRQWRNLG